MRTTPVESWVNPRTRCRTPSVDEVVDGRGRRPAGHHRGATTADELDPAVTIRVAHHRNLMRKAAHRG
jgi:hypothetical protein